MNDTMQNFGYPNSLIRDYDHWVLLLRPAQVTIGSMVLAAKSDAMAYSDLPEAAYTEQKKIIQQIEAGLKACFGPQKMNYLMLMMVDPHVHFHVIPRYEAAITFEGITQEDAGWPGPPNLAHAVVLTDPQIAALKAHLQNYIEG